MVLISKIKPKQRYDTEIMKNYGKSSTGPTKYSYIAKNAHSFTLISDTTFRHKEPKYK